MAILKAFLLAALLALSTGLPAAQTVNINTADKAELMTIQGVGERRAEAIIAYRDEHGPFKSVDDLLEVQGIGAAILDGNRALLSVTDGK